MTEQELRQLVRDAIAKAGVGPPSPSPAAAARPHVHPSFTLLPLPSNDGPCIIEPAVSCNHCGFCKTYGH